MWGMRVPMNEELKENVETKADIVTYESRRTQLGVEVLCVLTLFIKFGLTALV